MKDHLLEASLSVILSNWNERKKEYKALLNTETITIKPSVLTSIIDKAIEDITYIDNYIKTNH